MKRAEFIEIVKQAKRHEYPPTIDGDGKQTAFGENTFKTFDGYGLHNERIIATREQFAAIINYQALQLNGEYDGIELESLQELSKRIDLIN